MAAVTLYCGDSIERKEVRIRSPDFISAFEVISTVVELTKAGESIFVPGVDADELRCLENIWFWVYHQEYEYVLRGSRLAAKAISLACKLVPTDDTFMKKVMGSVNCMYGDWPSRPDALLSRDWLDLLDSCFGKLYKNECVQFLSCPAWHIHAIDCSAQVVMSSSDVFSSILATKEFAFAWVHGAYSHLIPEKRKESFFCKARGFLMYIKALHDAAPVQVRHALFFHMVDMVDASSTSSMSSYNSTDRYMENWEWWTAMAAVCNPLSFVTTSVNKGVALAMAALAEADASIVLHWISKTAWTDHAYCKPWSLFPAFGAPSPYSPPRYYPAMMLSCHRRQPGALDSDYDSDDVDGDYALVVPSGVQTNEVQTNELVGIEYVDAKDDAGIDQGQAELEDAVAPKGTYLRGRLDFARSLVDMAVFAQDLPLLNVIASAILPGSYKQQRWAKTVFGTSGNDRKRHRVVAVADEDEEMDDSIDYEIVKVSMHASHALEALRVRAIWAAMHVVSWRTSTMVRNGAQHRATDEEDEPISVQEIVKLFAVRGPNNEEEREITVPSMLHLKLIAPQATIETSDILLYWMSKTAVTTNLNTDTSKAAGYLLTAAIHSVSVVASKSSHANRASIIAEETERIRRLIRKTREMGATPKPYLIPDIVKWVRMSDLSHDVSWSLIRELSA